MAFAPKGVAATALVATLVAATTGAAPALAQHAPRFAIAPSPIQLEGSARPGVYLGGASRRAAFFGEETGSFEVWAWPLLLLRDLDLTFRLGADQPPIPGERVAASVVVRPELATIVYSHATFTVEQHLLAPLDEPGIVVLLDVDAVVPLEIEATFQASLDLMWPAGLGGQYAVYDGENRRFLLSESRREINAFVGSPAAVGGSTHPAHATPDAPSTLRLAVGGAGAAGHGDRSDDQEGASERVPIVIAGGYLPRDELDAIYRRLLAETPALYAERVAHAERLRERLVSIRSPDPELDLALEWAKVNLDEALACNPDIGCGLVAGYARSGRGRRPGFGWFFGGDASMNVLGIAPTGDFELARHALDFQRRHQRADGKMPHEVTQSAKRTREDWFRDYPYAYYHADTTPHWLVALWRTWLQSGDLEPLRASREAILTAYGWLGANDADGDLIVDNTSAGLGAVEVGGIGAGLHQDVYLAAVSVESLRAAAEMAAALGEETLAAEAATRFATARANLEREYYLPAEGRYAFGVLEGGRTNPAVTVWPALALAFDLLDRDRAAGTLDTLASHRLLSDWGARMLDSEHELYEPLQYNMGTVWGFVTGFSSWALYAHERPHAGFAALWAQTRTTYHDALGRHPELLSGAFFRTLDTTVPHQFFATSAIPTALLRGLLGLDADAPKRRLRFAPQLPADWDRLAIDRYPLGGSTVDVELERRFDPVDPAPGEPVPDEPARDAVWSARFERSNGSGTPVEIVYRPPLPPCSSAVRASVDGEPRPIEGHDGTVRVALDRSITIEIAYRPGIAVVPRRPSPAPGDRTRELHILEHSCEPPGSHLVRVEGLGGRIETMDLISPLGAPREVSGGELVSAGDGRARIVVSFEGLGAGFHERVVRFREP